MRDLFCAPTGILLSKSMVRTQGEDASARSAIIFAPRRGSCSQDAMVGAQGEDAKASWASTWKQLQRHQANGSRIYG